MKIGNIIIYLEGTKHLQRVTENEFRKPTAVRIQSEGDKVQGPKVDFGGFKGKSHDVIIESRESVQILPITTFSWKAMCEDVPCSTTLRKLGGASRKSAIKKFDALSEYDKVVLHCNDIVHDMLGYYPQLGIDYKIELL